MTELKVILILDPSFNPENCPSGIHKFENYHEFCTARYSALKAIDDKFSFRTFSREAGFGSPNYLKLVMDNKRNLSAESIVKFAKGLRLNQNETEYFRFLVLRELHKVVK